MNKKLILSGFALPLLFSVNALASPMSINIGGVMAAKNGLSFSNVALNVDPKAMTGSIAFTPSIPVAAPAIMSKPQLAKSNTIGSLKRNIVSSTNYALNAMKNAPYLPIENSDVVIYGGPFLNSTNSFTDAKVLAAKPNGEPYRVKITLSSANTSNVVQTVISGNFTIFTPNSAAANVGVGNSETISSESLLLFNE